MDKIANITKIFYKYIVPIGFTTFIIYIWPQLQPFEIRVLMSLSVVLFVRIENCFAFYRFYCKKSKYEYELTIFLATIKIINTFQIRTSSTNKLILVCEWIFDLILLSNVACYALAFLIILIFMLIAICALIRDDQRYLNIRDPLTQEDLQKLIRQEWHLYLINEEVICSICMCELKAEEEVVRLPQCNHYFHGQCINEWLVIRPLCPTCRNNIVLALRNV